MRLLYQYSAGKSFFHKLDPRTKVLFILCFLIVVLVIPDIRFTFASLIFVLLMLWLAAGISPKEYWPFLALLAPIMIAITIVQALSRGPPYYTLPIIPLGLSAPGTMFGLTIGLRLVTMGMSYLMFAMTTDPFDISLALNRTGVSFKYSYFIGFALRFFPLIQETLVTIGQAVRARGGASLDSGNLIMRLKALISCTPCLALSTIRRSQNIALAMELRGFSALESGRTFIREIKFKPVDYLVSIASLVYMSIGFFLWITVFEGLRQLGSAFILILVIGMIAPFVLIAYIYMKVKAKKRG